jgi:glycine/D-amino acid oxidase-like deaminating enzyme
MQSKTIIVGAGMAGMSCAVRLLEAGQDFLLVTDGLGGRIMFSDATRVNYGAYFVMGNYTHAKKLLTRDALLNPLRVCFHNSQTERFAVLSLRTLRRLPEFVRFFLAMKEFSSHYETFKRRCLTLPQRAALQADPYMADVFSKSAAQFVREKRYEHVSADYVSKFTYACTGASLDSIAALDFLNVSMGLMLPIHRFIFDRKAMAKLLGNHLVTDSIVSIENRDGLNFLTGRSGKLYRAENVVIATPASVTKELLGLGEIRGVCRIYVHHVKAVLKKIYHKYEINLFPYTSEIMLTARQFDGTYLIYSREKGAELNQVCDSYELIAEVDWEKAMYVHGNTFMEQQYGEGIYVAGDHNGLGLEPAAISGIYAAGQIIQKTTGTLE